MLQFICDGCMQYLHNVDFVLNDIRKVVEKNGQYIKEYKNKFEIVLKKSENEIQQLLKVIEVVFTKRMEKMKFV